MPEKVYIRENERTCVSCGVKINRDNAGTIRQSVDDVNRFFLSNRCKECHSIYCLIYHHKDKTAEEIAPIIDKNLRVIAVLSAIKDKKDIIGDAKLHCGELAITVREDYYP